ncbi:hypothetical protein TCAL_12619 [Tigriopus californicus]|uniref:Mediator of RNA polymerase II transcription subunit 16 n=1 Tax=Tigriopus californicus TaxID=6832 RepID=A0A553NS14_TIGCA|nr:mediator of RNA polymerase II transcription subunit 16-like isoform X1 [Tigriopus californicus]TRY68224.1 hypothetical protein TCAL_12619 [Tigriopus californicus]
MDLMYSTYGPAPADADAMALTLGGGPRLAPTQAYPHATTGPAASHAPHHRLPARFRDGVSLSSVSSQNVLLFTSRLAAAVGPPTGAGQASGSHVFVCDLNTPWDVHWVTSRLGQVTALTWDAAGRQFALADDQGHAQIWAMLDCVLSQWKCVLKECLPGEKIIQAQFLHAGPKTVLNSDGLESALYSEKFTRLPGPALASAFVQRRLVGLALISSSGVFTLITISTAGRVRTAQALLGGRRRKIKLVSMAFLRSGPLVVATSDGNAQHPILIHSIVPQFNAADQVSVAVEDYPGIFLNTRQPVAKDDDYQAVVELCFVMREDCDSILIGTHHESGGKVQLWAVQDTHHAIHKIFAMGGALDGAPVPRLALPAWQYIEMFSGPCSALAALATPPWSVQGIGGPGGAPSCYIIVAFNDGSIHCLLRDSLQHIASVDLPKSSVRAHLSGGGGGGAISSMCFTATANALVVNDSWGQIHLYRVSPISDPGGSHSIPYLVTMFEYCLVSGIDFWDLTLCTRHGFIEAIGEKLRANFELQSESHRSYYFYQLAMIESFLYRLSPALEYKAADLFAKVTLMSIHGVFKSALRTLEVKSFLEGEITMGSSVANILKQNPSEWDLEKLFQVFQGTHGTDLNTEPGFCQSFQHLIQWSSTLCLHILAGLPEYKQMRKGLGFDLHKDPQVLLILREILYVVRIWSHFQDGCLPSFTQGSDFNVVSQCFNMVTKLKDNPSDEGLHDDCLRLPSQVMLPPLNLTIKARGVAPMVVAFHRSPMSFEFGEEPDLETSAPPPEPLFIEGAMSSQQLMDCSRLIYLGKNPTAVKMSTRSYAMSFPGPNPNVNQPVAIKSWEKRWVRQCPSGGNWKIRHMTD